ncbi:TetR/AcrR family transcriptional regulator [Actinomadura rudentiformis]|uniref:TetR/AcrR family transcriptional regulator n=1 Tax=Actinomadura rudentiformis TaxID=359158 RepID=A0A6H9YQN5_9ACTN|nr:TetR/AcrR family transcriptional regulator [Actinomadura rudentiformis]KAB2349747.1 TetR/AcrR family transcriptional regulator [Actinomadura rudentiformis]
MARLTRVESQARTRELLIATARQLFLRDGYHATSLEKVAEAAGFSKGAVYSNFGTKDELCQTVIEAVRAEQVQAIMDAFLGDGSDEDRLAVFESWAERTIGDPGWTLLEAEFAIHAARRDPELRGKVATGGRGWVGALRFLLEEEARRRDLTLPLPAEELADALLSLGVGLGLRRAVDPALSPHALTDMIRLLLDLAPRGDRGDQGDRRPPVRPPARPRRDR